MLLPPLLLVTTTTTASTTSTTPLPGLVAGGQAGPPPALVDHVPPHCQRLVHSLAITRQPIVNPSSTHCQPLVHSVAIIGQPLVNPLAITPCQLLCECFRHPSVVNHLPTPVCQPFVKPLFNPLSNPLSAPCQHLVNAWSTPWQSHGGDVSSLLYATPPPSRSGPKAPGRGGGGLYDTAMAAGGSPPGESSRRTYAASMGMGGALRLGRLPAPLTRPLASPVPLPRTPRTRSRCSCAPYRSPYRSCLCLPRPLTVTGHEPCKSRLVLLLDLVVPRPLVCSFKVLHEPACAQRSNSSTATTCGATYCPHGTAAQS